MKTAIAFGIGALLFGVFGDDHGVRAVWQARHDAATLSRQIAALRKENAGLRRKAEALRADPEAIENEARGALGLVRPGEIVVVRSR